MKRIFVLFIMLLSSVICFSQTAADKQRTEKIKIASQDTTLEKKAALWVRSLDLSDTVKVKRIQEMIFLHLKAVRDWNNDHPYTTVPAGINPVTGKTLSELDRQVIANSAIDKSVHENLMSGLRKELNEQQVESILDKYTVGKVAFTMAGYHSIVPNITATEEAVILGYLKQAREQAIDYKNMNQISAIFKIYKTKCEQYFNENGRNWKQMFKNYADAVKAKKGDTENKTNDN